MRTEDVLINHELELSPPPQSGLVQQNAASNGGIALSLRSPLRVAAVVELLPLIWLY
jgi:hypothetical protein